MLKGCGSGGRGEEDLDACVGLAEIVHRVDGYPKYLPGSLREFLAPDGALAAWVAVVGSAVVGHVALHSRTSPEAGELATQVTGQTAERLGFIARLLVSPQSRRRGIGRALLDVAAAEAVGHGLLPVLDVVTEHHAAIALYERCDWIRIGRVTARFRDGGELEEFVYVAPPPAT